MIIANEWTIKFLYKNYQQKMDSIEWDYHTDKYEDYSQYQNDKKYYEEKYVQAMRLIFSKQNLSFGYFAVAEDFIEQAYDGIFTASDGIGYWVDWDGNKIEPFSFSAGAKRPKDAVFVAWYNK